MSALNIKPNTYPEKFPEFTYQGFASLVRFITAFTDRGQAVSARIAVAKAFNFTKTVEVFGHIGAIQDIRGGTNAYLQQFMKFETDLMLDHLEFFYGETVALEIREALQ